jgi:hypothetical protein
MSLSLQAIDRVFDRLLGTYGNQWIRLWDGVELAAVKSIWAYELSAFASSLQRIAWALENLPERCPNVIEFKRLCHQAQVPEQAKLPEPVADPERVKAELAKLGGMRKSFTTSIGNSGNKDWAHRIIARHEAGEKIRPYNLKLARQALGLPVEA